MYSPQQSRGPHTYIGAESAEPMFSVKTTMFKPRKKVLSQEVLIGIFVYINKIALVSILELLRSNILFIIYSFSIVKNAGF